jgi:hypothetical protein
VVINNIDVYACLYIAYIMYIHKFTLVFMFVHMLTMHIRNLLRSVVVQTCMYIIYTVIKSYVHGIDMYVRVYIMYVHGTDVYVLV